MVTMRSIHPALLAVALALLSVFMGRHAAAQDAKNTLHIGILSSGSFEIRAPLDAALVEGLRARGYVEGKNLVVERRYGVSRINENANELAGMKLDAILTTCTPSTRLMKEATAATPIVMAAVSDPVQQGLIASLSRPGRNVTGTSSQAEELLAKRLELLTDVLPKATRVAVLTNARNPVHALSWQRLERAAAARNLQLIKAEISDADDLPAAMDKAARAKAEALLVLPDDPLMINVRAQIVGLAEKHRIPDMHWAREFVEAGGFMSYGESLRNSYVAAASYMARIKNGADPAVMPVEQPTRFELVVNMKTARALGIAVPQSLLLRADDLIQ
jgi:putative tryptophan/tyrosine transport system substrate-binding protein